MPIAVSCPTCKASFKVSDQFAGKQGPCPKCKTPIKIPKAETPAASPAAAPGKAAAAPGKAAAAPGKTAAPSKQPGKTDGKAGATADPNKPAISADDIKIHAPETVGPKTSTGRPVIKPIMRKETKVEVVPIVIIAAAWLLRKPLGQQVALRAIGLMLVSPPLALGGYWFLRDDELEPYRGRALWLRAGLCALVYAALWGAYLLIPDDATTAAWSWMIFAPPFFLVGAGAAYATLDLEAGNAFFHYCFYVLVTLLLGLTAGLHMPWQPVTKTRAGARTAEAGPSRVRRDAPPARDASDARQVSVRPWFRPTEPRPAFCAASGPLAACPTSRFFLVRAAREPRETSVTSGA
jgi:hypothetical protein